MRDLQLSLNDLTQGAWVRRQWCGDCGVSDVRGAFCLGHFPVISTCSEKLRNVRIATMPARGHPP